MEQNGCTNKTFRLLESIVFILVITNLIMLCITVYFITLSPEDDYCYVNRYDINQDGEVDITDTLEMTDYILEQKD